MSNPEFAAFDYQKQCWVAGNEAIALLRAQLTEEIELLQSPKGLEYVTFLGSDGTCLIEAIRAKKAHLASLPVV